MRPLGAMCVLLLLAGCDRFTSPETRVERADAAMAAGNYGAAVVDLKNALQKKPDFDQAHLLLADAALWLGDARGAEQELGKIKGPVDQKRRDEVEIRLALAQGKAEEALQRLDKDSAGSLPPGRRELLKGRALMRLSRFGEAQQAFEAVAAADDKLGQARAGALEARIAQGDRAGAQAGLLELTKVAPESAEAWLTYGLVLAGGDLKATIGALQQARTLAPRQLPVPRQVSMLVALAEAQLQSGDIKGAGDTAGSLARVAPESPVTMYIASRISMANNDYAGAVDKLRKVKESAPGFLQARVLLGMALLAEGNAQQASVELNDVLAQNPVASRSAPAAGAGAAAARQPGWRIAHARPGARRRARRRAGQCAHRCGALEARRAAIGDAARRNARRGSAESRARLAARQRLSTGGGARQGGGAAAQGRRKRR